LELEQHLKQIREFSGLSLQTCQTDWKIDVEIVIVKKPGA